MWRQISARELGGATAAYSPREVGRVRLAMASGREVENEGRIISMLINHFWYIFYLIVFNVYIFSKIAE
jgi:hypothetical protein